MAATAVSSSRPAFPLASLMPAESYDEYVNRCAVSVGWITSIRPRDGKGLLRPPAPGPGDGQPPGEVGSYLWVETGQFLEFRKAPTSSAPSPTNSVTRRPLQSPGAWPHTCHHPGGGSQFCHREPMGSRMAGSTQTARVRFLGNKRLRMEREPDVRSHSNKTSVHVDG